MIIILRYSCYSGWPSYKPHAVHDRNSGRWYHSWCNEHGSRHSIRYHAPCRIRRHQHTLYPEWPNSNFDAIQHSGSFHYSPSARVRGKYTKTPAERNDPFASPLRDASASTLYATSFVWRQHTDEQILRPVTSAQSHVRRSTEHQQWLRKVTCCGGSRNS